MPVISPRRSSTSASGSLYGTSTSGSGVSSTSGSKYSSSYLTKPSSSSSSSYSPSFSYLTSSYSSYSPRAYSNRSAVVNSSYLTGGASVLGTYRTTSAYLGSSSSGSGDTSTLSRYGDKPLQFASNILC